MGTPRKTAGLSETIIRLYESGKSGVAIGLSLNLSGNTVYRTLAKLGVKIRCGVDEKKVNHFVSEYESGKSSGVIAKESGLSGITILRWLESRGIKRRPWITPRKYPVDETAFDSLTDDSAYWIGFILADGNVHTNNGKHSLNITASVCDREHLHKFCRFMGTIRPLCEIPNNGSPAVSVSISSAKLIESLARWGVHPRKSKTASVIEELADNIHFWRGVIDGDGCLTWTKSPEGYIRRPHLQLVGSYDVCSAFAAFSMKMFPNVPIKVSPHKTIWEVRYTGPRAAKMATELYRSGTFLDRKRPIALAFSQSYIDHPAKPWCLKMHGL